MLTDGTSGARFHQPENFWKARGKPRLPFPATPRLQIQAHHPVTLLFISVCAGIHLAMRETRGRRERLLLLLSNASKTSSLTEIKACCFTGLAGEPASGILLSPLPNTEVRDTCRHVLWMPGIQTRVLRVHNNCSYPLSHFSATPLSPHGFWGSHSGPCVFKASTFLTKLFQQSLSDSFLNTFFFRSC